MENTNNQTVVQAVTLPAVVMPESIKTGSNLNVQKANELTIKSQLDYEAAGEFLKVIKGLQKQIEQTFSTAKENAVKTHKSILAAEKIHLEPLSSAELIIKHKMGTFFQTEQKRIADEKRKQEDEERQRRIQEQERLAKEQKAREDQALKDAEVLKAAGDHAAAEAIITEVATETKLEAMPESVPIQTESAPKTKGVSTIAKWTFEITDPSKVNRAFLMVDESKIRKTVSAMGKDAESLIGGVKIFQDIQVRARV